MKEALTLLIGDEINDDVNSECSRGCFARDLGQRESTLGAELDCKLARSLLIVNREDSRTVALHELQRLVPKTAHTVDEYAFLRTRAELRRRCEIL